MKKTSLAWRFGSSPRISLALALKKLGRKWTKHDSDYRLDSISGRITAGAWARIFEVGLGHFIVNLTVEVQHDADLESSIAKAKERLFRDVLPLLGACEIEESTAEAANDYMSGEDYYLS